MIHIIYNFHSNKELFHLLNLKNHLDSSFHQFALSSLTAANPSNKAHVERFDSIMMLRHLSEAAGGNCISRV